VKLFVAAVICLLVATPAGVAASPGSGTLLHRAARLSGLPVRRAVPTAALTAARYDALLRRAYERDYPRALQRVDAGLYARLGLMTRSIRARESKRENASRAWYDTGARKLLVRRPSTPKQRYVLHELARALVDQSFNLRRLRGLRGRDRDKSIAAHAIVEGTAALASGLRASSLRGTPLDRFLALEREAGLGPGRALASELRYLGGRKALATALRTFPQTTEQLLHIDKFLERERALPVRLPARTGAFALKTSETFGELDVRALLRAFSVPNAVSAAEGWGGGRLALYATPQGGTVAALVLRWDSPEDAVEWRDAVPRYVGAAFPDALSADCPPLDRCWSATAELATGTLGDAAVFVSGPGAAGVAADLLVRQTESSSRALASVPGSESRATDQGASRG
jgi:hypothetical protein